MKKFFISVFLLLSSLVWSAEVIRYVDPDATGAGDGTSWTDAYTSLSAWEAAEQTDLVTDGDWHHVYVRSSGGTADTTATRIVSWTTGPANYIVIEAVEGDEALKTGWSSSRYRLVAQADGVTGALLSIEQDYTQVIGLQFELDANNSGSTVYGITNASTVGGLYRGVRVNVINDGNAQARAMRVGGTAAGATGKAENCIVTNAGGMGIYGSGDNGGVLIYNCVVYGCGIGISTAYLDTIAKNCASFNNTNDFDGTFDTIDYCASDDGDGTNNVSPSGADWTNEFSAPASGNFTLLNTGNLYDAGVGPGTDANVPTIDIDGDSRSGATTDIGADEYVAGGSAVTSIYHILNQSIILSMFREAFVEALGRALQIIIISLALKGVQMMWRKP